VCERACVRRRLCIVRRRFVFVDGERLQLFSKKNPALGAANTFFIYTKINHSSTCCSIPAPSLTNSLSHYVTPRSWVTIQGDISECSISSSRVRRISFPKSPRNSIYLSCHSPYWSIKPQSSHSQPPENN
jgi:hypothetical protein